MTGKKHKFILVKSPVSVHVSSLFYNTYFSYYLFHIYSFSRIENDRIYILAVILLWWDTDIF